MLLRPRNLVYTKTLAQVTSDTSDLNVILCSTIRLPIIMHTTQSVDRYCIVLCGDMKLLNCKTTGHEFPFKSEDSIYMNW